MDNGEADKIARKAINEYRASKDARDYPLLTTSQGKRELFFLDRPKLPAYNVFLSMQTEGHTIEQAADNWSLSVEAVKQAIDYCSKRLKLLKYIARREEEYARGIINDDERN